MLRRRAKISGDEPSRRRTAPSSERVSQVDLSSRYAFRRNRTLTGSSSAEISSSNELNAELRSPRAHVHHLTSVRRKLLMYLGMVSVASFTLYILVAQLTATTVLSIVNVPSPDQSTVNNYSNSFESYFAARPVERFRSLLDRSALLSHIQVSHPEICELSIEPGSKPGEASVRLTARTAIARWSIDGANQYVDGEGVVFAKNYFEDPELQIVDNSGIPASSSKLVASNRFLGFIGRVVSTAAKNNLRVAKVTIPALTTRQVSVTIQGSNTEYKLSVDRSPGNQVEDIGRIARYLAANNLSPSYVDVRIAGKAFYK